jgi:hypothetical protein
MYPLRAKSFMGDDFEAVLKWNFAAHMDCIWARNSISEMSKRAARKFF